MERIPSEVNIDRTQVMLRGSDSFLTAMNNAGLSYGIRSAHNGTAENIWDMSMPDLDVRLYRHHVIDENGFPTTVYDARVITQSSDELQSTPVTPDQLEDIALQVALARSQWVEDKRTSVRQDLARRSKIGTLCSKILHFAQS